MATNNRYRKKKKKVIDDNYKPPFDNKILQESVESLNFRNENTLELLKKGGIKTLRDLVIREEKDFYRIFTFKKRNLIDVIKSLKTKKLYIKPAQKEQSDNNRQNTDNRNQQKDNRNQKTSDKKKKSAPPPLPSDIYVKFNKNGKWGFADRTKKVVVQPQYDEVSNYKEDLCVVEKDEHFGFIDREGVEVIPIIYECALSFSEGLACVFKGGKCGYVNKENEIVIDFQFDAGTSVENGKCHVKRDEKWGELTISDPTNIRWIN